MVVVVPLVVVVLVRRPAGGIILPMAVLGHPNAVGQLLLWETQSMVWAGLKRGAHSAYGHGTRKIPTHFMQTVCCT